MKDCYYCEKGEKLNQLMTHIADMGNASIYLFRDQTHKGKCIEVFNTDHRTEWYQLNQEEQSELIYAVAKTAEALHNVFNPDKINYATYGDKVSHLHVHVVPKYENGPDWGGPFKDDRTPVILSEEEYIRRVEQIREHLT